MARTHIIIPVIPVLKPATINDARARFASVLIDLMDDPPKEEQMDRIEMLLWGRTFGKRHDAASHQDQEGK